MDLTAVLTALITGGVGVVAVALQNRVTRRQIQLDRDDKQAAEKAKRRSETPRCISGCARPAQRLLLGRGR